MRYEKEDEETRDKKHTENIQTWTEKGTPTKLRRALRAHRVWARTTLPSPTRGTRLRRVSTLRRNLSALVALLSLRGWLIRRLRDTRAPTVSIGPAEPAAVGGATRRSGGRRRGSRRRRRRGGGHSRVGEVRACMRARVNRERVREEGCGACVVLSPGGLATAASPAAARSRRSGGG
jgi:hypothetical protein